MIDRPTPANSFKQLISAFEELFDEAVDPAPTPPASACLFPQAPSALAANPPCAAAAIWRCL